MPVRSSFISDEKLFTLAPYSNRRNDQIIWRAGELEDCPDDLRHVGLRQREAGAMFLGIVASEGNIGPPIWVPVGVKVNAAAYQDLLRQQVRPWIDAHYTPGTWVLLSLTTWQRNGAHRQFDPEDVGGGGLVFWGQRRVAPIEPGFCAIGLRHTESCGWRSLQRHCANCRCDERPGWRRLAQYGRQLREEVDWCLQAALGSPY